MQSRQAQTGCLWLRIELLPAAHTVCQCVQLGSKSCTRSTTAPIICIYYIIIIIVSRQHVRTMSACISLSSDRPLVVALKSRLFSLPRKIWHRRRFDTFFSLSLSPYRGSSFFHCAGTANASAAEHFTSSDVNQMIYIDVRACLPFVISKALIAIVNINIVVSIGHDL